MSRALWHISQVLPMATAFTWAVTCIVTSMNITSRPSKAFQTGNFAEFQAEGQQSVADGASLFGGTAVGAVSVMAGLVMYILNFSADKYVRTRKYSVAKSLRHRKNVVVVTACLRGTGAALAIALSCFYASKANLDYVAPTVTGLLFAASCGVVITFTMLKKYERVPAAGFEDQAGYSAYGALPQQGLGYSAPAHEGMVYGIQPQQSSATANDKPVAAGQTGWQAPPPYQSNQ